MRATAQILGGKSRQGLSLEMRRAVAGTANHTAGEGSGKFLTLNTRQKGRREKVAERPTLRGIQWCTDVKEELTKCWKRDDKIHLSSKNLQGLGITVCHFQRNHR